jgi:pimeloyl-ACP methyl ester carboxylesterase
MRRRARIAMTAGLVAALVAAVGAAVFLPRLDAVRFLIEIAEPPLEDGAVPEDFEELRGETLRGPRRAWVVRPGGAGPHPVLVLVHGVTEKGIEDGRVLRLARALHAADFLVVVPEIRALVRMENEDRDEERLVSLLGAIEAGRLPGADGRRMGIFGVSVGGGLALWSVARHRAAGGKGPRALCLVGAPDDVGRVAWDWFRRPPPVAGAQGSEVLAAEAGRFARNALLRLAATRLVFEPDRTPLRELLAETWQPAEVPAGLSTEEGRRFAGWILAGPALPDEAVAEILAASAEFLDVLSLAGAGAGAGAAALRGVDLFLVHGAQDPLVPISELPRLAARLAPYASVRTLESRFVGHAEVSGRDLWAHVQFVDGVFDAVRAPGR